MIDVAILLRAPDEKSSFFGVFVCFLIFGGNVLYHNTDNGSLTQSGWRSCPGCYSLSGPGIIGPTYTTITTYHHIAGGPAVSRNYLPSTLCLRLGGKKNGILSNKWFGEHWHWLYESHLWATMQLQLISFVLIILHCMDYTGCQQHSSTRHRQHKRE